jgi:hypothetical protein
MDKWKILPQIYAAVDFLTISAGYHVNDYNSMFDCTVAGLAHARRERDIPHAARCLACAGSLL